LLPRSKLDEDAQAPARALDRRIRDDTLKGAVHDRFEHDQPIREPVNAVRACADLGHPEAEIFLTAVLLEPFSAVDQRQVQLRERFAVLREAERLIRHALDEAVEDRLAGKLAAELLKTIAREVVRRISATGGGALASTDEIHTGHIRNPAPSSLRRRKEGRVDFTRTQMLHARQRS
jgi:hypothetical protein